MQDKTRKRTNAYRDARYEAMGHKFLAAEHKAEGRYAAAFTAAANYMVSRTVAAVLSPHFIRAYTSEGNELAKSIKPHEPNNPLALAEAVHEYDKLHPAEPVEEHAVIPR